MPEVGADLLHAPPGDAVERGGEHRRVEPAFLHDEDVLAAALGDEPVGVQQQALVVAVLRGLEVGEDGVGVGGGHLGARHGHVHVVAREGRGLHADAAVQALLAEVGAPGPGGDRDVHLGAHGRHAHLLRAVEGERADVAALQLVGAHHLALRLHELLAGEGHVHHVDLGRVEQPVRVLLQPEDGRPDLGLVGAHPLEDRQPVVQRVGEDVGRGFPPGHELAVVPDEAVAVGHRHDVS